MKAKMKLMLLAVLMSILAGPALASPLAGELGILTPETLAGNNPATGAPWMVGDQYRLVFHTSATTNATSTDIATYNAWVQGLADASPLNIGATFGGTWKVIGSTAVVDARDNTSTNPTVNGSGHAIFLLDGSTLVANDYADLWDGAIQNIINITEQGTTWAYWPWTGTLTDGTAGTGGSAGNPLGSTGQVGQGNASSITDWVWRVWTMDPPEYLMPMYALSDPLVIILAGATNPSPANGATVPAGDVVLSWTNMNPNVGSDVWVDVWFGTDPVTDFTKVVDAGLNTTSVTVNAPVADTYYWQVNSYVDGSPTGDPIEGNVWIFYVDDTDGDGMPDAYELLHTSPPSPTALNPGDDLEPDGLTNIEEYQLGTNPNNPDTDGDTLLDGDEIAGAGLRPPTDPLDADTDDDTLDDGVETNTGTFVSASDTGTDPTDVDSDADGLKDGVETGTGVFIDESDTGTDPTVLDSDSDGAEDWYEVAAAYTDPTDPGDNPVIPYPLPDPDGSTGNSNPVKVYIMSGQSNMVGFGRVGGTELGTLNTITNVENKFPNLVDEVGAWTLRNDVKYRGVISAIGDDVLMPGFGANSSSFGPELGFGHVMGYYHDEPVLLIKTSIGNRSLGWDCLPPGSPRFDYNGYTYAGYGDGTGYWPIGEEPDPPVPGEWYAGKQYDEYFMDEADWAPAAGSPVFNVTDILDNFATEYPEYAMQGFEIAGFVWWQGHKDQSEPYASRYEFNMVNFIKKLRQYYENRYPANIDPNAPFVLATIAFSGWDLSGAGLTVANAQLAVSGETGNYPEFAGNVKTMEARGYWRDFGPSTQGYHYYHNAETYMLVGDALGRAMVELISGGPPPDTDPPTPNPATFASPPAAVSDTEITMTATTGSDATGPVEYYFDEISGNPGGTDSGWTTNPVYNDTGLTGNTQYTYTVQMRDSVTPVPNVGTASAPANATTDPTPDTDPPTPDPATFASPPAAVSDTEITMTATTGSDATGPVEYFFDEISGNPGGTDSGWTTNPVYNDTGLTGNTQYTYTVQMRDSVTPVPNVGTASASANATTDPTPDTDPPTPNPATFASPPAAVSDTEITMTATTGSDATGPVEYYFDEISGNPGGTDSGWTTNPVYNDTGLSPSTQYTYTVQMRDAVTPVPNTGTVSSPASATTDPAPAELPWTEDFESGSFTAGGWTTTGSPTVSNKVEYSGTYGAKIPKTSSIETTISTVGFTGIHVKYRRETKGFDSGENLVVEWYDGSNWNPLETVEDCVYEDGLQDKTCGAAADNNANFRIRFRTNAGSANEYASIDDIEVTGTGS